MKRILIMLFIIAWTTLCSAGSVEIVRRIPGSQLIEHTDYILEYCEKHEQAYYVAYILTRNELKGTASRKSYFRKDPLVTTGSASHDDYTNSGYDRGHLAPAADMVENDTKMKESFYMSNVSPQEPSFNRGIWKQLEEKVRRWAIANGRVVIVTGPVLRGKMKEQIGKNRVSVPRYFYKVVLDPDEPSVKAIGFIIPNTNATKKLSTYAMPVDDVEKYTGLDFFPYLSDSLEERVEAAADYDEWNR
ncbi:MAG: DNA/RNA non-specific endonuclease [Spirochaetota bacterium]